MSLARKMIAQGWDHDAGAHRIEEIVAFNPDLEKRLPMIALRFISEKGLSQEFANLLREIETIEADPEEAVPAP
ncbi:hypothetical protein LAZ40_11285 [Cereibacter sphaeroides]|uniref:hypothetical protein n=1 Tax=Cereibacter sphaeroides TaxID=1063 RepID=UPI001F17BF4F|nr:hypothetical protein [Cereibacter sphaeroides]MCE6959624.1 hypothetical protein [Cereibacter sphaeroides]MCE6974516.1 hypothetical protein [Cereibacter sphaeroides]